MCVILGWCGAETPDNLVFSVGKNDAGEAFGLTFYRLSQIATFYYFAFFLIILPVLGLTEKPKDRPESITKAVLGGDTAVPAPAE